MRALIAFLVLMFLGPAALFADVASAVDKLRLDVDARIAAIGEPATKESKALTKAKNKLALYTGHNDVAGVKILAAGGKLLIASRTTDQAILADVVLVVNGILELADRRRDAINDAIADMVDPSHADAVRAAVADAEALYQVRGAGLPARFPGPRTTPTTVELAVPRRS